MHNGAQKPHTRRFCSQPQLMTSIQKENVMLNRHFTISVIAMALLLAGGLGRAQAKDHHFTSSYSGSGVDGDIDTNNDGIPAAVFTGIGKSNFGRFVFTGEGESGPQVVPNTTCPAGTLEFPVVQNTNVFFFQATGEQLIFTYTPGTTGCYDPTTNTFTYHFPGTFSGGTGRFAHATGTFEDDGSSTFPVGDAKGHTYSTFSGTVTGT